jgi:hypothetical protein
MFLWHDKPHIASTAHYLARVFPSRLAIARGDFIEDSIGQRARMQMKEGNWAKWACWLYYPEDGKEVCVRHRHGRTWKGAEADMEREALYLEIRAKHSNPLPEADTNAFAAKRAMARLIKRNAKNNKNNNNLGAEVLEGSA